MGNMMTLMRGEIPPDMTKDECDEYNEEDYRAPVFWYVSDDENESDGECRRFNKDQLIDIHSCDKKGVKYDFSTEDCVIEEEFTNKRDKSLLILICLFLFFRYLILNKKIKFK